jgi:hypothetical protein
MCTRQVTRFVMESGGSDVHSRRHNSIAHTDSVTCCVDSDRLVLVCEHCDETLQQEIILKMIYLLQLLALIDGKKYEAKVFGHLRRTGEPGLHPDDRRQLDHLFKDVWGNDRLLPDYDDDLDKIRCPKQVGVPHTIWCDEDGCVLILRFLNC